MNLKKIIKTIWRYLSNSNFRFRANATKLHLYKNMPDKTMLDKLYVTYFNKHINWNNPRTFNEKIQWLKLYDRKPIYTTMVDKYEAKKYVAELIGEKHIIPTLGVWSRFEDIEFDMLPNKFVLKCTHDSGGIVICKDKSKLDISKARNIINKSLRTNFYYVGREWPYKNVKPRIIAEKYMVDDSLTELRDYKFFCFNGVCKCLKVDFDRFVGHRANYYDTSGNLLTLGEAACPPDPTKNIILPAEINEMILLAEKLSKGITFLRVDFYYARCRIYFGELTFYPASGLGKFVDEKWDNKLGEWLILPHN